MSTMTMTAFDNRLLFHSQLQYISSLISSFIRSMFDSAFTSFLTSFRPQISKRAFAKNCHTGSSSCAEPICRCRDGIEPESKVESVSITIMGPSWSLNKSIDISLGLRNFKLRSSIILRFFVSRSHRPGRRKCSNWFLLDVVLLSINHHVHSASVSLLAFHKEVDVLHQNQQKITRSVLFAHLYLRSLLRAAVACC